MTPLEYNIKIRVKIPTLLPGSGCEKSAGGRNVNMIAVLLYYWNDARLRVYQTCDVRIDVKTLKRGDVQLT